MAKSFFREGEGPKGLQVGMPSERRLEVRGGSSLLVSRRMHRPEQTTVAPSCEKNSDGCGDEDKEHHSPRDGEES